MTVGSHLPAAFGSGPDAQDAAIAARELLGVMGMANVFTVMAGSETPIASRTAWKPSAATAAIVREAMRDAGPSTRAAAASGYGRLRAGRDPLVTGAVGNVSVWS